MFTLGCSLRTGTVSTLFFFASFFGLFLCVVFECSTDSPVLPGRTKERPQTTASHALKCQNIVGWC